jgi:hypothetical protein
MFAPMGSGIATLLPRMKEKHAPMGLDAATPLIV